MTKPIFSNLLTLDQARASVFKATPKHAIPTQKAEKAKSERVEKKVKVDVRSKCATRDGPCVLTRAGFGDRIVGDLGNCDGPSEWAHLEEKRRSKTRGQPAEVRHTSVDSCMMCRRHHARYDGRERPRIAVDKLTKRGADGPLRFKERK